MRDLEAFAFQPLAFQLSGAADRLGSLASPALRRLFKVTAQLHFPEDTFPLHLFFERLQRLIDIVIANENLHLVGFSMVGGVRMNGTRGLTAGSLTGRGRAYIMVMPRRPSRFRGSRLQMGSIVAVFVVRGGV